MRPGPSRAGQGKAHLHEAQGDTVPWTRSLACPRLKLWENDGAFLKARAQDKLPQVRKRRQKSV